MSMLTALVVATPLFGFALQGPDLAALDAELGGEVELGLDEAGGDDDASLEDEEDGAEDGDQESSAEARDAAGGEDDYVTQMRRRNNLADLHRPLGIATWVATTAAVVFGSIQYYNLYGYFADRDSNPCVTGEAIFGQGQCTGTPLPHAISAGTATLLYAGTLTLAILMPDPDNLSEGKGEFASTLRMHKFLRWVHLIGMLAQGVLGYIVANGEVVGLDRTNDYGTLQGLATVHWGIGIVTYAALTWAGSLMLF